VRARVERRDVDGAGRLDEDREAEVEQTLSQDERIAVDERLAAGDLDEGVPISSTRATIASSDIFSPPWNAYSVSHHVQRSGQPVSRTNVHGSRPRCSRPGSEWKISVMRRNSPAADRLVHITTRFA
jgi:hypothetical protein